MAFSELRRQSLPSVKLLPEADAVLLSLVDSGPVVDQPRLNQPSQSINQTS